jgi:hypothetical protein
VIVLFEGRRVFRFPREVFGLPGRQQPGAFGYSGGLYPVGNAELAQDVGDMDAGGSGADVQLRADLPVGAAGPQQAKHQQWCWRR